MLHLEAVQPERGEGLDAGEDAVAAGMGEDGNSPRVVHELDRVADREMVLRHERRLAAAQVAVEGFALVAHPPAAHDGPRDVRPTDGAAPRLGHHGVHRHRDRQRVEAGDHLLGARPPRVAEGHELSLDQLGTFEVKAEQVDLALAVHRAQLDAGDHAHAERLTGGTRFGDPTHRVVIGQGEGGEPRAARVADHLGGGKRAVGGGGMRVQIHQSRGPDRGARRCAHLR